MKFTEELVVLAANIETRKSSPALAALIDQHRPDAVVVEQAYRARRWLRGVGGYRLRQYHGQEASGIAVLVKHGVAIEHRRALRMRVSWVGPKAGIRHNPRTYPLLHLLKGGVGFKLIAIHLPTFNNPGAQQESKDAIAQVFERNTRAPVIAAGDWNLTAAQMRPYAERIGAKLRSGGKVDHALASNVEEFTRHDDIPTPSGCHGWALYTAKASRETP